MGDHESSKSLTRWPQTDTVLHVSRVKRPLWAIRALPQLSIDDDTDQRGHAVTMNTTTQGCRPGPLELELHILVCRSCTTSKERLNRESSEHTQGAGELMERLWLLLPSCVYCTCKAAGSPETSAAVYQTARCNSPESSKLRT